MTGETSPTDSISTRRYKEIFSCENQIACIDGFNLIPVSNTGRLKTRIFEPLDGYEYDITVELVNNMDTILKNKAFVVSSGAIILNECISWLNMAASIISECIPGTRYVELG